MKTYYTLVFGFIFLILCIEKSEAQTKLKKETKPTLYISYVCSGLGSDLGTKQPVFVLKNNNLIVTSEQTSFYEKKTLKPDTICKVKIRKSSVDSIQSFFKSLKDTSVYSANLCVSGGLIHFLNISNGKDTARYELMNSFDYTCLSVINIINGYLPIDKKLPPNEQLIKDAEACQRRLKKLSGQ